MSKFTNSYPHYYDCRIGQHRTNNVKKRLNSVAVYKQQLIVFVSPVIFISDLPVTPYVSDESKPVSPPEDEDGIVSTASESSLDKCLEDRTIQPVIIKPILVCPGVVLKINLLCNMFMCLQSSTMYHHHFHHLPSSNFPVMRLTVSLLFKSQDDDSLPIDKK